jgi:hypothetical protein
MSQKEHDMGWIILFLERKYHLTLRFSINPTASASAMRSRAAREGQASVRAGGFGPIERSAMKGLAKTITGRGRRAEATIVKSFIAVVWSSVFGIVECTVVEKIDV